MTFANKRAELPSYVSRLKGLDAERSQRIYQALCTLSRKAVEALKGNQMNCFTAYMDKMRPLMSYINTNTVTLSDHLENEKRDQKFESNSLHNKAKSVIYDLRQNLKIIEVGRKAVAAIPFSPLVFSSKEMTNAHLDCFIPLAWDFEYDAIILVNLSDERLLDYLVERGQKRFFLIGGSLEKELLNKKLGIKGLSFWAYKDASIIRDLFLSVTGKPPGKFIAIDCGSEKVPVKEMNDIVLSATQGRVASWHRFNTLNRADSVNVLENLNNLVRYRQTSELHGKFDGIPGVIVSPGPSLKKNLEVLKKLKGKAIIICVLRVLGTLLQNGIEPDMVIQADPYDLKDMVSERNGQKTTLWEEWIERNDFSKVKAFINTMYASPNIFEVPVRNVFWMNPSIPVNEVLPLDIFDYQRVGGSVAHAAFDILVELGCSSIVLVGQDLAYSESNEVYAEGSNTHARDSKTNNLKFGEEIDVEGHDGKPIKTNNVFLDFARLFTFFAEGLKGSGVRLYNCSEGGLFLEGFEHCKLDEFLKNECKVIMTDKIEKLLNGADQHKINSSSISDVMGKFIGKSISISEKITALLNKIEPIMKKKHWNDADLKKFDKIQNKIVKRMGENYFYTLALQKDSYILQAGLRADNSLEMQLGFHKDFLQAIEIVNERLKSGLFRQRKLFKQRAHCLNEARSGQRLAS
tara:strand:+ start:1967 stop:4033 length:2067 start_codon:yes stop_codon:yes gene_type:complete